MTREHVLSFDGSAYVELANPFPDSRVFTISMWLRPATMNSHWQGFIGKQGDAYRRPGMWVCPDQNALFCDAYSHDGIRFGQQLGGFFFKNDQWIHVAWVKAGTSFEFYRNGCLYCRQPAPENIYVADTAYWIGRVDNFYSGAISDVRIWRIPRTASQIQREFKRRQSGWESGLVGYWPMDDGYGQIVRDKSVVGNHATMHGATWQKTTLPVSRLSRYPHQRRPVCRTEIIHPHECVDVSSRRPDDLFSIRMDLIHGANFNDPPQYDNNDIY